LYKLSKKDKAIIKISKLGYKVVNGKIYNPKGTLYYILNTIYKTSKEGDENED